MTRQVGLSLKVELTITARDIREPVFAYDRKIEGSRENREAERHGQPLVSKRFIDSTKFWVEISLPDLPCIYCLDEKHGRLRGVSLEEALARFGDERHVRISWGHEHFITARWEGIQVLTFEKSYQRLREILGEEFPKDPQWKAYGPTPETLEEIAAALKGSSGCQEDPLPF